MKNLIFIFLFIGLMFSGCTSQKTTPAIVVKTVQSELTVAEKLVQAQLDGYNGHDLTAFLAPYAEDVKIYQFPNTLLSEGKAIMRENYQFIENTPDLYCKLVNRVVEGNTVIDHEHVTINKDKPLIKAIAIYKIKDDKIAEVYFIQ